MRQILLLSLLMAALAAAAYSAPPPYANHPEIRANRAREQIVMQVYAKVLGDVRRMVTALEQIQDSRGQTVTSFMRARQAIVEKLTKADAKRKADLLAKTKKAKAAKAAKEAEKKPVPKPGPEACPGGDPCGPGATK